MRLVSGSLNRDWYPLVPGDLIVPISDLRVTWPPDGVRRTSIVSGSLRFDDPLEGGRIPSGSPLLLIVHVRRGAQCGSRWYRATWSIIHDGRRLWWVGTSTSGSL